MKKYLAIIALAFAAIANAQTAVTNEPYKWELYAGAQYEQHSAGVDNSSRAFGYSVELARYGKNASPWGIEATGREVIATDHAEAKYGVRNPTGYEFLYGVGPAYRFNPKAKSILALHLIAGSAYNGINGQICVQAGRTASVGGHCLNPEDVGLFKDQPAWFVAGGGDADFGISPHLAIRLEPEIILTTFQHSDTSGQQVHFGLSTGIVYRFGGR